MGIYLPPPVVVPAIYVAKPKSNVNNHSVSGAQKLIVTREQIAATGSASLSQVLQNLGGVQLQDMAGNNSQVLLSLRGFGANAGSNTLFLVNGIPITNPDFAPPNLNAIPLHAIEYIEIIAGSESVLYGDQAVGGIINIVTSDTAKEKYAITCGTGSYNQYHCDISLRSQYKRLSTNTTLTKNFTDNYRQHNQFKQNLLTGNMNFISALAKLALDYNVANENMQFPGALTREQVRQNRRQAQNFTNFFSDWNGFLHLKMTQKILANLELLTDIAHHQMAGHGVLTSNFSQNRNSNYIRPQIKTSFARTLILAGADLENDFYRLNSSFGLTKDSQAKYGIFSLAKIFMNTKTALSIGIRGAQQNSHLVSSINNDNINRAVVTTLGITYQLLPNANFYLRRAGNFRFPKADEDAATPPSVHGLKTQTGVSYEAGIETQTNIYYSKINIYQLNLRDEIAFDPTQTPQSPFGTNQNLAPTTRRGITLSGKRELTQNLSLDGQLNLVAAHFQSGIDTGKRIPLVSESIFRTGLNYRWHDNWNFYSEAVFTGNQFADNDNANIAGKIGGYTIYNFNLGYTLKNFSANFRVNNIFNKYYNFYTVLQSYPTFEFFYPAPGRNFNLALTYNFL